jgi:hypothetical protein
VLEKPNGSQSQPEYTFRDMWIYFAINWANYSAMERSLPLWRRTIGWILLAAFATFMLVLAGFGIIAIIAGITAIQSSGLGMVVFGVFLLLSPILVTWSCIRRLRTTGSLRTSKEELLQMGARITEWENGEGQKPLRSKIGSTVIMTAIVGLLWMVTLRRSQHPHESWGSLSGLITLYTIYAIWIQFRKPKSFNP